MDKIEITKEELEELLEEVAFKAATRACNNLYKGLERRYLLNMEDDNRALLQMVEDIMRGEY